MEELQELNRELKNPGVKKLLIAARRRGIKATQADAKEVQSSSKQIFAQPPKQRGAHATNSDGAVWQADLASLVQYSAKTNKNYSYFLLVVDLFSREVRTEPLQTKSPQEVWEAFANILDDWGKKPQICWTDSGQEFGSIFQGEALKKGITIHTKEPEDTNGIAVADAAMKQVKEIIFREMAEDDTTSWINYLDSATQAYNATPHGTTYGLPPEDVGASGITKFRLYQDNGRKLQQNSKQLADRSNKLEAAGAFRTMLPRSEWQRAFKPRYSGPVKKIYGVEGGFVKSGGKKFAIARVQPVAANTASSNVPAALAQGNEGRNEKNRLELQQYVPMLKKFIKEGGGGAKSSSVVGKFLNERWEFTENIKKLRLSSAMAFVKLFPEEFEVTQSGNVRLKNDKRPRVRVTFG